MAIDKQPPIRVVDAMPGTGKTTWMFKYMQENRLNKWIFVSPYLDEVGDGYSKGRIQKELPECGFKSPSDVPSKTASFLKLIEEGQNVAITHSLFTQFNPSIALKLRDKGYHIIIDETIDLVSFYEDFCKDDILTLRMAELVIVGDKGRLEWNHNKWPNYKGRDEPIKNLCDLGCLWLYGEDVLIQRIPPAILLACESVTILTYMFSSSMMRYWMDLNSLHYEYIHPEGIRPDSEIMSIVRDNINIILPPKGIQDMHYYKDSQGRERYRLGTFNSTWYQNTFQHNKEVFDKMRDSMVYICRTQMKGKVFWTTFKDYKDLLEGTGYKRARRNEDGNLLSPFVPKNMRASNEYRSYNNCLYTINIYPNGSIEGHLRSFGIDVDRDSFALSELIQFVFRGSIRQHLPMNLCILSDRMRGLFTEWLEE